MLVLDASVAVKWYVVEEFHENALSLLDADAPLRAPRIIELEVASAIMARSRRGEIPPDHAEKLVRSWLAGPIDSTVIHLVENRQLLEDAAPGGESGPQADRLPLHRLGHGLGSHAGDGGWPDGQKSFQHFRLDRPPSRAGLSLSGGSGGCR